MWRSALVLLAVMTGAAAAQDAPGAPSSPNAGPGDPVVRVTLNSNSVYDRGDRARVFVKVRDDGYIIALLATPDGRVRPLYPAEPTDENHVSGGSKFEIRSREEGAAFVVNDTHGTGMVYVAYSTEPFKLDNFMTGDHWDNDAFPDSGVTGHEEAVMTDLVQQMATGAHFDYDLASYRVAPPFHRDQVYADNGDNVVNDPMDGYYPAPLFVGAYGWPWWEQPAYYDPYFYPYAGYGWGGWGGPFIGVGFGFGFGGGCWGCGFYGGGFWHRPGWGVGYHGYGWGPGVGVGYRSAVYARGGAVFAGRTLGTGGVVGYRGGRAGFAGGAVGTRSVFANANLSRGGAVNRSVGTRTVFPQTAGRSANVPANSGRVFTQGGPAGANGGRAMASRVPSAQPAGGGFAGGRGYSSPGYGAGSRAPMPVARRVEPSAQSSPSFDRTQSAPRSGGGGAAHSGGGGGGAHGGGGGGHHFSSFGGGGSHGGGGGRGGGGGGHHR
jgi:Domain of unknown function (DUF4384)